MILRRIILHSITIILLLACSSYGRAQTLVVNAPSLHFGVDTTEKLILVQVEDIKIYEDLSMYTAVELVLNQDTFNFTPRPSRIDFTSSYAVEHLAKQDKYSLYFTDLPIIKIQAQDSIVDEPKRLATFSYADKEQAIKSNIGIEIRGGHSQGFPKKTYDLEFWDDTTGEDKGDVQFGNLRSDDDWILDAMYNEPLRLRSFFAHKLWLSMHTPYYQSQEPKAKSGADVAYVELFMNDKYTGVYTLSEEIDRKLLQLKKPKAQARGELYKGTYWDDPVILSGLFGYNNENVYWGGFEYKYPKPTIPKDWFNLYAFIQLVTEKKDFDFILKIWNQYDKENFVDYYLFLNLLRATDNTGKNIYVAKYNTGEPYFYVPWDLDGCFGTLWDGTDANITNDILTNGLFKRVSELNMQTYHRTLAQQWFAYRSSILSETVLLTTLENQYAQFLNHKIYERESIAVTKFKLDTTDIIYLKNWLQKRLAYLDSYFNELQDNYVPNKPDSKLIPYPNPTRGEISIKNFNEQMDKDYIVYTGWGGVALRGTLEHDKINLKDFCPGVYYISLNRQVISIVVK